MLTTSAPTDRATAETYLRAELALTNELAEMMRWDDLLADLYRAADQTWNVHLIDPDLFWAIVHADRVSATSDDRRALVLMTMGAVREDMGADEDVVRELMRDQWTRRRAETAHRTYAVPFDDDALALSMPPADYDDFLALATDGDHCRPQTWTAPDGWATDQGNARDLFDVLVLA